VAAAAGATVPQCRCPPGVAPSPLSLCPDGPTVTTVITAPVLRPGAMPAMVTLGNDDAATAAVAGKADDAGQENNDHGSDGGDDDENDNKWGRGA
jgi:hypothetical protein